MLPGLRLAFTQNEIRISGVRLEQGEELAILIDQYYSRARIYAPFEECQRLASLDQYELVSRRHGDETFVSQLEQRTGPLVGLL